MAVTLEVYRSRIGQFYSNRNRVRIQYNRKTYIKSKGRKNMAVISLLLLIYLVPLQSTCSSTAPSLWQSTQPWTAPYPKQEGLTHPINHNFLARYRYRNKRQNKGGISIIHWNKGSSLLANKMGDLSTIIDNYKPLVLGLSEANFKPNYR